MNRINPDWSKHLEELENHYSNDNFFKNQNQKPTHFINIKNQFDNNNFIDELLLEEEGQLNIDIAQDDNFYYITAPIAGITPKDLEIFLEKDVLTITGQRHQTKEISGKTYLSQECHWGKFSRSIVLPTPVKPTSYEATFNNSILEIKLEKDDLSKKIQIKVKQK